MDRRIVSNDNTFVMEKGSNSLKVGLPLDDNGYIIHIKNGKEETTFSLSKSEFDLLKEWTKWT